MTNHAVNSVAIWHQAVALQYARLLPHVAFPMNGPLTREADAYLLAIALRNLVRGVTLAKRHRHPSVQKAMREALARFDAGVPNSKNIRDVLEHFDRYAAGTGDLQAAEWRKMPHEVWIQEIETAPKLYIGIAGRSPMVLDCLPAGEAGLTLGSDILALL
jgi:hypothetical protein